MMEIRRRVLLGQVEEEEPSNQNTTQNEGE